MVPVSWETPVCKADSVHRPGERWRSKSRIPAARCIRRGALRDAVTQPDCPLWKPGPARSTFTTVGPPPLVPSGPPLFPEDHLACYDISGWPADEYRWVEDQVQLEVIWAVHAEMLCVPSTKSVIERAPSLAPWGIATLGLSMLLTVFWIAGRRMR